MKISAFFQVVTTVLVLCLSGTVVFAQSQVNLDYPETPKYDMKIEDFNAQTKIFDQIPYDNRDLAYSIRIPLDWEQTKTEVNKDDMMPAKDVGENATTILGEIVRFYGPSLLDSRTYLSIQASELANDITAKNWFLNFIYQSGYTLQALTEISKRRVEALYVVIDGDTSYVVRTLVEINGQSIFYITLAVPEQKFQAEKAIQQKVLESFKFRKVKELKIEETRTYAFLDLLRFDYPETWKLVAPNIYSIEAMDAKISNSQDEKIVKGEIDVHVVSTELDTTLAQEVKQLQKGIEERGLMIGKLIEQPTDFKPHEHIYFSRVEIYEATDKNKLLIDHEYWIAILLEDRYFYIVTMLTPARKDDFYIWATNIGAFKTVVETLRP